MARRVVGEPKTRTRMRYMIMSNALLSGEAAPVFVLPKQRLKPSPKGGSAVANFGSLFDVGEGAVSLGLNAVFAPRRTATAIRRGFTKDYRRAELETRQGILEPVFYGVTHREKERRNEEQREMRRGKMEDAISKNPQLYEEHLDKKPYNPQDIQPNFIPRGLKSPKDQNIRTSYKPSNDNISENLSLNVKTTRPHLSNLSKQEDLEIEKSRYGMYPRESNIRRNSFPDFSNINLTSSVRKTSFPDLKIKSPSKPTPKPAPKKSTRSIPGSQYLSQVDKAKIEKQLGLTPTQKEKKRKYYKKKSGGK